MQIDFIMEVNPASTVTQLDCVQAALLAMHGPNMSFGAYGSMKLEFAQIQHK